MGWTPRGGYHSESALRYQYLGLDLTNIKWAQALSNSGRNLDAGHSVHEQKSTIGDECRISLHHWTWTDPLFGLDLCSER